MLIIFMSTPAGEGRHKGTRVRVAARGEPAIRQGAAQEGSSGRQERRSAGAARPLHAGRSHPNCSMLVATRRKACIA